MFVITKKINEILKYKNLSQRKLSELIKRDESYISHIFNGKNPFPKKAIKKLLPILEVSREEFDSWVLADKYPKEILKLAIQAKKEFPYKRKSILTAGIDRILEEKEMSRTNLATQIKYSQSGLNRMITGKIGMSKPVMEKIAPVLEVSFEEVLSWAVADKHKLPLLEQAYRHLAG